jgi:hypothetical protein
MNVITDAIVPALDLLGMPFTRQVCVPMCAIGLQESRLIHRVQILSNGGRGPARGLWQFERGGGTLGVLSHDASRAKALALCKARNVVPDSASAWAAFEFDDILAAGFARLLLWTDARPLPAIGDVEGTWRYYLDNWRPGKPHRKTWDRLYAQAVEMSGDVG